MPITRTAPPILIPKPSPRKRRPAANHLDPVATLAVTPSESGPRLTRRNGIMIVQPRGPLDSCGAIELRNALPDVLARSSGPIIFDMRWVSSIDGHGFGALLH